MTEPTIEPSLFIIFGGTGDLSLRKLLPALCRLDAQGRLVDRFAIIAVGRSPMDDEVFRQTARDALAKAKLGTDAIETTVARIHYQAVGNGTSEEYQALGARLETLGRQLDIPPNHTFYMSLPPRVFQPTIAGLGEVGLNHSAGWTRIVVEKPFGTDLESARALNRGIHEYFSEDQIYRIDHYLGKETVQNLLVFRLANAFIESSWNRERVDAVQITVGEHLGVGTRAEYYDHSGALRDMVQNHITQLLTLVAMEVPSSFSADAIRAEKIKVLRSLRPISDSDIVRGRYIAGEIAGEPVRGYMDEQGVPADSQTETFVALRMFVDSWRWQGVPFYVRTGKCMPHKTTQIAVRFRSAPVSLFRQYDCELDTNDVLTITLQPNEGFAFYLDIKKPGSAMALERIPLRFDYHGHFDDAMPDAYDTLLLDVLEGDQTLFVHADEVEESWRIYTPVIQAPPPVCGYAAGTWGPPEADHLAIPERDLWQRPKV